MSINLISSNDSHAEYRFFKRTIPENLGKYHKISKYQNRILEEKSIHNLYPCLNSHF